MFEHTISPITTVISFPDSSEVNTSEEQTNNKEFKKDSDFKNFDDFRKQVKNAFSANLM